MMRRGRRRETQLSYYYYYRWRRGAAHCASGRERRFALVCGGAERSGGEAANRAV